ncbi:MAG: hypothetical protein IMF19_03830 [Proteobacteria bacterium]|nr:hypothetical protein [Pseudomonadota bacterium]
MTSLSNTASEELGEVVANLKKGYLEKFPEDIQDEILAHCDRLLEAMEKGNGKQPENNPTKVKNLFRYLDQCKMDKAGALAQIKKDSFEGMSKSDQDQIIKYASK